MIAPPTYFGSASSPTDNGTGSTPATITPPSNMLAGDLVYVEVQHRSASTINTVSVTGGQAWKSEATFTYTNGQITVFWCTYNGTWSANPQFASADVLFGHTAVMHVFRPGSQAGSQWAIDVAQSTGTFTAGSSPFTKTITGITTGANNAVVIACWATADDNTWGTLSGTGWSVLGSAQYRNLAGNDQSMAFAYRIQPQPGATGNVSLNQATLGGDAGATSIISFKEIPAIPSATYVQDGTNTEDASSSSIAATINGVTAGNLIVAYVKFEGTPTTISLSDGTNSFTPGTMNDGSNGDVSGQFLYLLSSSGGNKTYTVTLGAARTFRRLIVKEFAYSGTISLDVQSVASGVATAAPNSGNVTTTGIDEICCGSYGDYSATASTAELIDLSTADHITRVDATHTSFWHAFRKAPFTGAASCTIAINDWLCHIITFKITH